MTPVEIDADYLIVGAGAGGMGFADVLLRESEATVVMVDRHANPGGHWNDAYPFVRLHQPSHFYGVESCVLGDMSVQRSGLSAGLLHAASGPEIVAYYDAVMQRGLLPTGRLRYFPMCDYDWNGTISSLVAHKRLRVNVRKRVVDATYFATSVPSRRPPSYSVAPEVRCMPLNDLPNVAEPPRRFTVVGSGKTGMDACLWLLESGVEPGRIRWIMPRDAWWFDRAAFQLADGHFNQEIGNLAAQFEALRDAVSVRDLFDRLEANGALLRLDGAVRPTMFHGASTTLAEVEALRTIKDVIRLGRVQRVEADRIVLVDGEVPATPNDLYIDCSANGIGFPPPTPVFAPGKITLQMLKIFQPSFSYALIAHVEAAYADDATKNDLCRPVPAPQFDTGWLPMMTATLANTLRWSADADLTAWIARSRLDPAPKLMRKAKADDPDQVSLVQRTRGAIKGAVINASKLMAEIEAHQTSR